MSTDYVTDAHNGRRHRWLRKNFGPWQWMMETIYIWVIISLNIEGYAIESDGNTYCPVDPNRDRHYQYTI